MSFSSAISKVSDDNSPNGDHADQMNENDDEPLDPRIQIELERANAATSEINNLETQLDEAQQSFQTSFSNCKQRLAILAKKLGSCVERARPYYDACKQAEEAQLETQKAAQEYQRSVELYRVAKETLSLAESRLLKTDKREFDAAWQEYVNHATMKVMQAEHDKTHSERTHEEKSKLYQECEQQRVALQRSLKRSILKSKPYFDAKEQVEFDLQNQKLRIEAVQKAIIQAKKMYRAALNNLERISEEIHMKRKTQFLDKLPPREPGVGSDKPDEFIELPTLELTEFPKIDLSDDEDEDGGERNISDRDDEILSNSISSISIDGCSINNSTQQSGTSSTPITSDYESFADYLHESSHTAATVANAKTLTNLYFDDQFSVRTSERVNGEGSSSSLNPGQRRTRINGTSSNVGALIKNETPLLAHLFGTHRSNSNSSRNSQFKN